MQQSTSMYDIESECSHSASEALAALRLLRGYNHLLMPADDIHSVVGPLLAGLPPPPACLPPYCHLPVRAAPLLTPPCDDVRRRGEKRPIPAEMKDDKYFERRRRNNQAAKKSRDARRIREDQIAWRACVLEQENASLRAHIAALRHETLALRALLAANTEHGSHIAGAGAGAASLVQHAPSSTTVD